MQFLREHAIGQSDRHSLLRKANALKRHRPDSRDARTGRSLAACQPADIGIRRAQAMDRMTPPSARTAAPLTAEDKGLHTKATTAATSSGAANRCRIELGRAVWKKFCSAAWTLMPCSAAMRRTNSVAPSDAVGPGSTAFTVTEVPMVVSASPREMASCAVFVVP